MQPVLSNKSASVHQTIATVLQNYTHSSVLQLLCYGACTWPETRGASLSLVPFPGLSLPASCSQGIWGIRMSCKTSASGSSTLPLSIQTCVKRHKMRLLMMQMWVKLPVPWIRQISIWSSEIFWLGKMDGTLQVSPDLLCNPVDDTVHRCFWHTEHSRHNSVRKAMSQPICEDQHLQLIPPAMVLVPLQ